METRQHHGYGHGLRPGTTSDINCADCQREDAAKRQLGELKGSSQVWKWDFKLEDGPVVAGQRSQDRLVKIDTVSCKVTQYSGGEIDIDVRPMGWHARKDGQRHGNAGYERYIDMDVARQYEDAFISWLQDMAGEGVGNIEATRALEAIMEEVRGT